MFLNLVAEFISKKSVHFQFYRGFIIPKSLKCSHSATKLTKGYWALWARHLAWDSFARVSGVPEHVEPLNP